MFFIGCAIVLAVVIYQHPKLLTRGAWVVGAILVVGGSGVYYYKTVTLPAEQVSWDAQQQVEHDKQMAKDCPPGNKVDAFCALMAEGWPKH